MHSGSYNNGPVFNGSNAQQEKTKVKKTYPRKRVGVRTQSEENKKIKIRIEPFEVESKGCNANRADHVTISHESEDEGPIIQDDLRKQLQHGRECLHQQHACRSFRRLITFLELHRHSLSKSSLDISPVKDY